MEIMNKESEQVIQTIPDDWGKLPLRDTLFVVVKCWLIRVLSTQLPTCITITIATNKIEDNLEEVEANIEETEGS